MSLESERERIKQIYTLKCDRMKKKIDFSCDVLDTHTTIK